MLKDEGGLDVFVSNRKMIFQVNVSMKSTEVNSDSYCLLENKSHI